MLTEGSTAESEPGQEARPRRAGRRRRPGPLPGALAFAATAALVLLYALRGGGSYDIVTFEEYGLAIWWVVAIAIALGLLPRRRPPWPVVVLIGALAAYAAWTGLSLIWTQSAELTTEELARSLDYLGLVVLVGLSLNRETWRPAAAGLGFGALLICVVAVGTRLDPSVFGRDQLDALLHSDRLSSPFGYWNSVGAWGAMCTALTLTWSAHDDFLARRSLALAFVPVAGTAIYLTYSRAAIAGTVVALLAVFVMSRNRIASLLHIAIAAAGTALVIVAVRHSFAIARAAGTHGALLVLGALLLAAAACASVAILTRALQIDQWRVPRPLVRPLLIAAAILVVVPGVALGPRLASDAWHSFTRTRTAGTSTNPTARLIGLSGTRYAVWKSALDDFEAHPLVGTGAGTFAFWWNQHGTTGEEVRDVHNIWLQNLAELGVPGLLLIIAVAVAALLTGALARVRARRTASAGIAGALLAVFIVYLLHASVDWMWESTAVTVFALAAIAIASARLSGEPIRLRLRWRLALALAAAVFGIVQLPGLLSTAEIRRSQAAERSGQASAALAWARDAVSAEPWSASAHQQEGLVLESAGRLKPAKQQLTAAISDEPYNYRHWLIRSRIETELGQLTAAVADYARARELRPEAEVFAFAPYFKLSRTGP